MKKYILLAILATCTIMASAQQFKWGVRGALNISSLGEYEFSLDRNNYEDTELDSRVGLYAGLFGQYNFTEKFGIESGLFYAQLGGKDKENDYGESYKLTANPSYLQLPVTAYYKFNLPAGFQVYPSLGIYAGYGLAGKIKASGAIFDEIIDSEENYFGNFAKRFDFGGTVGLNVQYSKFIVGFSYDHGFLRVNKHKIPYGDNAYNSNFRCSLSYIFN